MLKIDEILARSLSRDTEEISAMLRGTMVIGNRLSEGSHRYEIHTLQIDNLQFPEYWQDHFRYELKKNSFAAESLTVDDSSDCSPTRRDELLTRLDMAQHFENPDDIDRFIVVSFFLKKNHEVTVFILPDTQSG